MPCGTPGSALPKSPLLMPSSIFQVGSLGKGQDGWWGGALWLIHVCDHKGRGETAILQKMRANLEMPRWRGTVWHSDVSLHPAFSKSTDGSSRRRFGARYGVVCYLKAVSEVMATGQGGQAAPYPAGRDSAPLGLSQGFYLCFLV